MKAECSKSSAIRDTLEVSQYVVKLEAASQSGFSRPPARRVGHLALLSLKFNNRFQTSSIDFIFRFPFSSFLSDGPVGRFSLWPISGRRVNLRIVKQYV